MLFTQTLLVLSNLHNILFDLGFPCGSAGKESFCNAGDPSSIPGSGRSAGERIGYPLHFLGFPCGSAWQRICLQCRRPGFDPWVGKIPWRRERLPTPVFWPGEFHGLYTVHGVTKSRTRLSDFHFHFGGDEMFWSHTVVTVV